MSPLAEGEKVFSCLTSLDEMIGRLATLRGEAGEGGPQLQLPVPGRGGPGQGISPEQ